MKFIKLLPDYSVSLSGSQKLNQELKFNFPVDKKIGEVLVISSLNGKTSKINEASDKQFINQDLNYFFKQNQKKLFNNKKKYPLISKFITTEDLLSVYVQSSDNTKLKNEQKTNKAKCWYVLDCPQNAHLIYGHHAKTKQELSNLVSGNYWIKLLKK